MRKRWYCSKHWCKLSSPKRRQIEHAKRNFIKGVNTVGKNAGFGRQRFCLCKNTGRANFTFSPDFKTLVNGLQQKGYGHFIIDLSECVHMDSTFLGVLAGFGMKMNQAGAADQRGFELFNPNTRITELLENLGALQLFKVTTGTLQLPDDIQTTRRIPSIRRANKSNAPALRRIKRSWR